MSPVTAARRRLQPLPWLSLTIVWVLLMGEATPGNLLAGVLVAAVILVVFPLPPVAFGVQVRLGPLLVLLGHFGVDVCRTSLEVAYKSVAPWVHPTPMMLRVPLHSRHELFTVLTAEMVTLVPGSIVVDIDRDNHTLLLHVMDAPTQRDLDQMYDDVLTQERRLLRALARRAEPMLAGECDGSEDRPKADDERQDRPKADEGHEDPPDRLRQDRSEVDG